MSPARDATNAGRRRSAKEIFNDALELAEREREAFVEDASVGDPALRERVLHLLALHDAGSGFLGAATVDSERAAYPVPPDSDPSSGFVGAVPGDGAPARPAARRLEGPGSDIGPYRLLEHIGEGGFGTVFMAEQNEPVRRRVALKIIKPGMDTRQVIARFEAERQALAIMDHPNIARVLDAGETPTGLPYFAMELVRGDAITEFCGAHHLDIRQRLGLFIDVCHAVQHAHQKGVIHRDIKPSNVLVSMHDDKPVPKVIDFGIAKALHERLTDKTLFTEFRQLIGTPEYMSPEQTQMSGIDVDTRSDVYSLGVLLYELLTGVTPFDRETLRRSSYDDLRRIIREVDPPKPSTRVQSSLRNVELRHPGGNSSSLAAGAPLRDSHSKQLVRSLRGDLDWIVMKCLEKDRTRRYETTSALAADVQRYLVGEPVVAAPPSRLYRVSKTLRRNRTAAVVAAGFVLLTAAGLAATITLWRQAASARDAESDQRARAQGINEFLKEMLTAAEPAKAKGEKLTVREALDRAARRIEDGTLRGQPVVEAEIRFTVGSTYYALGSFPQAEMQLRAADVLQSRELGNDHRDTLRTRSKLAYTLDRRSDAAGAAALAKPTMEAQIRVLGPDHPDTLQTMLVFGSALAILGRFSEAEPLLLSAIERLERSLGQNDPATAEAMNQLGVTYSRISNPEKAERLHREALRIHTQTLGEEDPATQISMHRLARSLAKQGRNQEAEALFRKVLDLNLRFLGADHRETLGNQGNLASTLAGQGRHVEAEPMYRECLAAYLRNVGLADSSTLTIQRWLAECLIVQRRFSEAEPLLREALEVACVKYGPEHGDTSIRLMCALSSMLAKQHRDAEAEQIAGQALEFQRRQLPRPWLPEFDRSSSVLIDVLLRRGANDEALRIEQELIGTWLAASQEPGAGAWKLNRAAHRLLHPANEQLRDARRALHLALRANELSGETIPAYLASLATAHHLTGETARAIEIQKKALSLLVVDAPDRAGYEERLSEFERTLEARAGPPDP